MRYCEEFVCPGAPHSLANLASSLKGAKLAAADRRGRGQRRVMVFDHIAAMNSWRGVVEAQLSRRVFSGLYDRAILRNHPRGCRVEPWTKPATSAKKLRLWGSINGIEFERVALHMIYKTAVDSDAIFYFH